MNGRSQIGFNEVQEVISRVRPALENEGGEIELVEVAGRDARIRLKGSFTACVSSTLLLKFGIERTLREAIPNFGELFADVSGEASGPEFGN